ncbi:hypothetical protein M0R45_013551 [Rubus argutus]|uniref:Uncharacterized protein n=1 Tax=Rubus argutus TaxID=59490 RepID=A0AAW1XK43_RUBAR
MGDGRPSKSLHFKFFSSLKQVEKRLKLENPYEQSTPSPSPSPLLESNKSLTESLSSPIYLDLDHSNNNNHQSSSTLQESSEAPEAFLSCSPQFLPTQPNAQHYPKTTNDTDADSVDDIEHIVGVKGPKCGKEVERLEGWINYFLNGDGEGKIEPFRLAHLLLSKAAFVSEGADHGFGGLDFPSTIGDFLCNDPPTD